MSSPHPLQRDARAGSVLQSALRTDPISGNDILLVEVYDYETQAFFEKMIPHVALWNRRYDKNHPPSLTPPQKTYDHVIVRLPKSHAALTMILEMTIPLLGAHGTLILYGMTDEGIKGAKKKLQKYFHYTKTRFFKKRVHVLHASKCNTPITKKSLEDFATQETLCYDGNTYSVTFYPGMFAQQTLDRGTEILLDAVIPRIANNISLLDFGCGSAVIGRILHHYNPTIDYSGLDNDCIALHASKQTYNKATAYLLADSLAPAKNYDMIVSNPPMHTEKEEHTTVITDLIAQAPLHLSPSGKLLIVVQQRIPLKKAFSQAFTHHAIISQTGTFTVWEGHI